MWAILSSTPEAFLSLTQQVQALIGIPSFPKEATFPILLSRSPHRGYHHQYPTWTPAEQHPNQPFFVHLRIPPCPTVKLEIAAHRMKSHPKQGNLSSSMGLRCPIDSHEPPQTEYFVVQFFIPISGPITLGQLSSGGSPERESYTSQRKNVRKALLGDPLSSKKSKTSLSPLASASRC
ncbi:hypothetical protein GW17_00025793 [Ensete ventricosum]|nr:hypothetical protein GW17_00025793 [Ensete ventricosum]RZS00576.1 hypothetical protein BHM03_00030305 [Ensete ventricosum]